MTFDEIHALLTQDCGLTPDFLETGNGCAYFLGEINKSPKATTRIIRVHHDSGKNVTQVKRSVSSNGVKNVFVTHPLTTECIRIAVAEEIALYKERKAKNAQSMK